MKRKLTLWVDEDEKRILEQALKQNQKKLVSAITSTDFQRKFIRDELAITTELIQQIEKRQHLVELPTITRLHEVWRLNSFKRNGKHFGR
ncbi:hypothetical protein SAMN05444392_11617 [Seinonella peptonophila]|uniref:Uncharacterized protein n=1 Tax=Seinonella peptonophila TaxID=112248 RepID=A0A1M5AUU1_9BACL|nr:hypothetical protein [Seinonella peptonophila]SHF34031.1 hypothetical protein SAMN05444392_11617 [Seinonella peptonophila]